MIFTCIEMWLCIEAIENGKAVLNCVEFFGFIIVRIMEPAIVSRTVLKVVLTPEPDTPACSAN